MSFDAELDASELFALLKKKKLKGLNLTTTMAIIGEQLVAAVNDQFESEGMGKWKGHADSTIAKHGGVDYPLLKVTGALAASQHASYGPDFAEVSTDKFYAVFHVSDAPRHIIPLRNFYDLPEEVYTTAVQTILNEIVK